MFAFLVRLTYFFKVEFHTNLAICLISRYPFFQSFKRFLYFIHRLSQGAGISNVPIERYLSHLVTR